MQDRPSARELLDSVERFLERDVVPVLTGPKQYHARVAANVMRILARELALGADHLRAEWQGLDALLGGEPMPANDRDLAEGVTRRNRALCARIRAGEEDSEPRRRRVLAHVRRIVVDKLAVVKPEMVATA